MAMDIGTTAALYWMSVSVAPGRPQATPERGVATKGEWLQL